MLRSIQRFTSMVLRTIDRLAAPAGRQVPPEYRVLDRTDAERLLRERQAWWRRLLC
jgi:hypothetical protein